MTSRPIIFSARMVRALLAGTKTQTRRVIRYPRWANVNEPMEMHDDDLHAIARASGCFSRVPINYAPGDLLWVREALESLRFTREANAIDVHVANLHAPVMRIIVNPSPYDETPAPERRRDAVDLAAAILLALARAGRPERPKKKN